MVETDGRDMPAPLVAVWDPAGEQLEFVAATLRGLTMLDAAALEDATRRAVEEIARQCGE